MEIRDWIVIGLMANIQISATIFIFIHFESVNFATWAAVTGTLTGAYHWIAVKDSKTPDAT